MHPEHRKYASCAFCGKAKTLTKEHLFGKSIARLHEGKPYWEAPVPTGISLPSEPHRRWIKGGSPLLSLTQTFVCAACNSGPSGQSVNQAKPVIAALISGQHRNLEGEDLERLRRYGERQALLFDLVSSCHEIDAKHKETDHYKADEAFRLHEPGLSLEERLSWNDRTTPMPSIQVYIGHHRGVLGIGPFFNIAQSFPEGKDVEPTSFSPRWNRHLHVAKFFLTIIGELVLGVQLNKFSRTAPPNLTSTTGPSLPWPPASGFLYRNLLDCANPTRDFLDIAQISTNPAALHLYEHMTRSAGSYVYNREALNRALDTPYNDNPLEFWDPFKPALGVRS